MQQRPFRQIDVFSHHPGFGNPVVGDRIEGHAGPLAGLEAGLAAFGLRLWEFDMLAALRRAGAPYCLSPTQLFSTLMVTSGTMTHRLRRLEMQGWIERIPNAQDARSMLVQLTAAGQALIDRAVEAHVDNERQLLACLPAQALSELDDALSMLLRTLESPVPPAE